MEQFEKLLKTLETDRDKLYSEIQEIKIRAACLNMVIIQLRNAIFNAKSGAKNETTD